MKLKTYNKVVKKVKTKTINRKSSAKLKGRRKGISQHIPLEFFKGTGDLSIENTLNSLPEPIKFILSNGNSPIHIKSNSSIIEIETNTGLEIRIKTQTLNNSIPECKIYDKPNKTELLNTYKK